LLNDRIENAFVQIFMITDTLTKIPPTWNALVFYSPKNDKFLHLALEPWIKTGRVTMAPFPAGQDDSYMFRCAT
jgi:hypothetical protein